jgi:hypothetical protein
MLTRLGYRPEVVDSGQAVVEAVVLGSAGALGPARAVLSQLEKEFERWTSR